MKRSLGIFAALWAMLSLAHEAGHGPELKGTGPLGGGLSSVISAQDAEKGRQAPQRFAAETLLEGKRLRVQILQDASTALSRAADKEAKLILFFDKTEKPSVLGVKVEKGLYDGQLDPAMGKLQR